MGRKKIGKGEEKEKKKKGVAIFNKKKTAAVMKKAYELSTLCDIPVCVIIIGPTGDYYVWPEDPKSLNDILIRYMTAPLERRNRALSLSPVPKKMGGVVEEQQVDNMPILGLSGGWDDRINKFSREQLKWLVNELESKIEMVKSKMEWIKIVRQSSGMMGEGAPHYYGGDQQMMQPGMPYLGPNSNYMSYEEPKRNPEPMIMMMNPGGGFNNNVDDDYNYYNNLGELQMWEPKPLTWHNPLGQGQDQGFNGGQLMPFNNVFN